MSQIDHQRTGKLDPNRKIRRRLGVGPRTATIGSRPQDRLRVDFHDRNGQPVRRSTFYRSWRQATERAGLPGFKVRNLRHTGASLAVASGADLEHLKVRMGHESISTTSRFYLRMYEGRDAEIAKRLEELADDPDSQRRLRGL
jgi:integrase